MNEHRQSLGALGRTLMIWVSVGVAFSLAIAVFDLDTLPRPRILDAIAEIVPSINKWAAISNYPQHALLFLASMWLFAPILMWLIFSNAANYFPQRARVSHRKLAVGMSLLACISVLIIVLGSGTPATLGEDYADSRRSLHRGVLKTRMGMGFFGSLCVFITCYSIAGSVYFISRSLKGERR